MRCNDTQGINRHTQPQLTDQEEQYLR
jgi:hypothetical protein